MIQYGRRSSRELPYPVKNGKMPLGIVCLVDPNALMKSPQDCIGIWAFNELYESIGVGRQEFKRWEDKYGMASLGIDSTGTSLAPGYPVLSKVAWMSIDPVMLTREETVDLIKECKRAATNAVNAEAKTDLDSIRGLAEKALSMSAAIQFGHP
jgi:hypothetical protein